MHDNSALSGARPATEQDAAELVRLRGVMFAADAGWPGRDGADASWRARCVAEIVQRLRDGSLVAFVVDHPDGDGLVCSAVGDLDRRLPAPGRGPVTGHIGSVATDPEHRRRGHARAAVAALVAWFDGQGIERVDLHATDDAAPLYRSLGFVEGRPALRRHRPDGR